MLLALLFTFSAQVAFAGAEIEAPAGVAEFEKNIQPVYIKRGNADHAFIAIHGFGSSPFEVSSVANFLANQGYSVYSPVLNGFGKSVEIANTAKFSDWRASLVETIDLIGRDYSEISLIGFSTGGTTVIDLLLNEPEIMESGTFHGIKIRSAILLSPYLASHSRLINGLNLLIMPFADSISPMTLFVWTMNDDLALPATMPRFYNDRLPLKAARQVVNFGKHVREKAHQIKGTLSPIPVFIAYSEYDRTINFKMLPQFAADHFSSYEFYVFPKKLHVPHQIAVMSGNMYVHRLNYAIKRFIEGVMPPP